MTETTEFSERIPLENPYTKGTFPFEIWEKGFKAGQESNHKTRHQNCMFCIEGRKQARQDALEEVEKIINDMEMCLHSQSFDAAFGENPEPEWAHWPTFKRQFEALKKDGEGKCQ
jgi:hypothetical protein